MITVRLFGTVKCVDHYQNDGTHGPHEYEVENTVRKTVEVNACKQFPRGYPNLEGYVLSRYWTDAEELVHSFDLPANSALADHERLADASDLRVEMSGSAYDWVAQALLYASEHSHRSPAHSVRTFLSWDETDAAGLEPVHNLLKGFEAGTTPYNECPDDAWNEMVDSLIERTDSEESKELIAEHRREG